MEKIFRKMYKFFSGNWRIAVLDLDKGRWDVDAKISNIAYLKSENVKGRHILMQPINEEYYMLADDLNARLLQQHHKNSDGSWKYGRLVVETSPDNYQVWIHSSRSLSVDEKNYWLKKMHSDPGATPLKRLGRMPGFRNRKEKYRFSTNFYPLAKLIWVDWRHKATVPEIECKKETKISSGIKTLPPKASEICRENYEKGNDSETDFSYALALARRGFDADVIKSRIIDERENWENHRGEKRIKGYLDKIIIKVMEIIDSSM